MHSTPQRLQRVIRFARYLQGLNAPVKDSLAEGIDALVQERNAALDPLDVSTVHPAPSQSAGWYEIANEVELLPPVVSFLKEKAIDGVSSCLVKEMREESPRTTIQDPFNKEKKIMRMAAMTIQSLKRPQILGQLNFPRTEKSRKGLIKSSSRPRECGRRAFNGLASMTASNLSRETAQAMLGSPRHAHVRRL